jgi:hypothetical protein
VNHQPSSVILDYIPELESDDPRIEFAISEGEMENYEVTKTINDQTLHLKLQFDSYFETNKQSPFVKI